MRKRIPILLILVLACASAFARQDTETFGDFHGRTAAFSVRSIVQQDNGLIWFGTDRSLYSFDGYDLNPYPCPDGHIQINKLIQLPDGLLIGTNDGLYTFNFQDKSYRRTGPLHGHMIRDLVLSGDLAYAGTDDGLYRFDPASDTAVRILETGVFSLASRPGRLYVGLSGGLSVYDTGDGAITPLVRDPEINLVICILPEEDRLWISTTNMLFCLDADTGEILSRDPFIVPKALHRDRSGQMLVGTDNGLYRLNPADGSKIRLRPSATWICTEDRDRDLWFGTDDGLLHLQQSPLMRPLTGLPAESNAHYTALANDRAGRLWLGGTNGIVRLDPDGAQRHYTMSDQDWHIPHNRINRIIPDPDTGDTFFATDGGLLCYREADDGMERLLIPGSYNWIYDLLPRKEDVWAATFQGIYRLRRDGSVISHFGQSEGLSSNDVARILQDRLGSIWVMTRDQRVFRIDPDTQAVRETAQEITGPDAICADGEGRIWIAGGNQVVRITPAADGSLEQAVTRFHPDGKTEVYAITDADESIWICHSDGLFSIHKDDLSVNSLGTYRQYIGAAYIPHERSLILGSVGSVDICTPYRIGRDAATGGRAIILTGITVNGTQQLEREDLAKKPIIFPFRHNYLEIIFSDFNYNDEFPHRFDYVLQGRHNVWNGSVFGNRISLTALQPGRYRLSIRPAGGHAAPAELLSFRIRQPWQFSPVMLLFYLLILGAAIYGLIRIAVMRRNLELERRQRDELISQSRQKEAFFQDVAHEFKTPLSLVIGPIGKMLREAGPDTDVQSLELVRENATKLSALIHHTIDYYRSTGGVADSLISTDVEMVDFARSIFESYRENYPRHEFIFNSSHPRIPVVVDIVKIETVLNNLLSNACKYTPEGGSVLLTLERDDTGSQLVIKVSDTGIGIPEEELPFAFDRYFESSRTKQGGYDSTGIGLSATKKYVEMHGGRVSVDSDEDGTTFTVLLPCLALSSEEIAPEGHEAADDPDKPLIAIVDDNAQICNFLESLLTQQYRCVSSHNGKSGLKLCKDVLPDLIISDVRMPVMDGLEMCRQIRQYKPLSTIPIILLTAKDDRETEQRSIGLNIDVFLPKPFETDTLAARVNQLLANRKRMEQRIRMEMLTTPTVTYELSPDEKLLRKVTQLIEEHLDDADLSVTRLCELGEFNEKQLYRKVKQFTGVPPVEYIRTIRLKKAALLLQNGNYTISEVMYSVGFSNASYFTRAFSAAYNMTPSEYMKSFKNR